MADNSLHTGEDVDAILKIALKHDTAGGNELRERLNRSAEELGISSDALAKAEEQYHLEKKFDRFMAAKVVGFKSHLVTFFSVNVLLHVIWLLVTHGNKFYWPGIVLAAWGIAIASNYFSMKQRPSVNDKNFQRWVAMGEPSSYSDDDEHVEKAMKEVK